MITFLIKGLKRILRWLEDWDRRNKSRGGLICSCRDPNLAFGHPEYCFACRKSTGK